MKLGIAVTLVLVLFPTIAHGQHPWQRPISRDVSEVQRIVGDVAQSEPTRDLHIAWVWGVDTTHDPGAHEYEKVRDLFAGLLTRVPRVTVETAEHFPSKEQWERADLTVFYLQPKTLQSEQFALMDAHLQRGGGIVAIHAAFIQGPTGDELAARFGLAWNREHTRWGVLPTPSHVESSRAHGIFNGFPSELELVDELYWKLGGEVDELTVLATAQAGTTLASTGPPRPDQLDGKDWPLFWTKEIGKGRVFGSIPGHNLFTFNDPFYRIILLRGIAWTVNESFDPFKPLVMEGL